MSSGWEAINVEYEKRLACVFREGAEIGARNGVASEMPSEYNPRNVYEVVVQIS
jgi:hypothetical protein